MSDTTNHLHDSIRAACGTFQSLHTLEQPLGRAANLIVDCLCAGRKAACLWQWRQRRRWRGFFRGIWLPFQH